MRILLVDDDPILLVWLTRLLETERPDWETSIASNGGEAVAILNAKPFDLLVTDLHMPEMDGLTLLGEVRRDPKLSNLPLIFITSAEDRATQRLGMASGADDYLTKPFSAQELIQAIEARLRRQGPEAAALNRTKLLQGQLRKILTHRELEVLALIGRGMVTKEIAVELGLSFATVSVHRANIMRKLDLHNAAALSALANRADMP